MSAPAQSPRDAYPSERGPDRWLHGGPERGSVVLVLPILVWAVALLAVLTIDLGGYLIAAARAQQLADASALAAVGGEAAESGGVPVLDARTRAARLTADAGGELIRCACRTGGDHAQVEVAMPVPGLVLPRLGPSRVIATAEAVVTPAPGRGW